MFSFFLSKNRNLVVFIFLIILSISFMGFSATKFSLTFKEIGETAIYPFRYLVLQIRDGVVSVVETFGDRSRLKDQLSQKDARIRYYQEKMVRLETLSRENERLRRLLGYKERADYNMVIAQVIGRDPEANFSGLTLNKGRINGVEPGMPVFAYQDGEKGIVGIISESGAFSSKIKTFRNRDFSLGVFLPHSSVHGVAQGLGDNKNVMSLLYVDKEISLNLREVVETSVEGQIFPAGIYVGTISYIDTTDKTRLTHQAYLKPYIHLSQIQDVFIIKNFGNEQ
jgi:rod shape-determining protein MreC